MSLLGWTCLLPDGWEAKPLRSIADYVVSNVDKVPSEDETPVRLCNYTDVYNNEFITLSLDFMQTTASEGEIAKFGLCVDDVAITKDSESWDDIGVPALVRETASDLVCGYHLALMRPNKRKMDGAFLFRCLQAKPVRVQLELAANGVTRFGIPKSEIGAMMLPVPPLRQQRAIADYLDRETARLDGLVAAKERVLGLLAEKRRALITRAVTRGLDPNAPLRDSGIPWLGEIPAHWETWRLKHFATINYGQSQPPEYADSGIPFLRATNVKRGTLSTEGLVFVEEASLPPSRTIRLRLGDIVVVRSGAYTGDSAIVTKEWQGAVAGFDMVARIWPKADPFFVSHALLCHYVLETQIDPLRLRAAQPHLNAEELGNILLAMPPPHEQHAIVDRIAIEMAKYDALRMDTERTIFLLKERRAALIAAAVTGQIDVQGAA